MLQGSSCLYALHILTYSQEARCTHPESAQCLPRTRRRPLMYYLALPGYLAFWQTRVKLLTLFLFCVCACVIDHEGCVSAQVFCRSQARTCWPRKLYGKCTRGRCQRPGCLLWVRFAPDSELCNGGRTENRLPADGALS